MSEVFRVCPNCGQNVAMAARHCGECGYNTQGGYPLEGRNNLPAVVAKVGLPVAAGLAGLALRAGLQLLQKQLPTLAANALSRSAPRPAQPRRGRGSRFIHIRSKWSVGDRNGGVAVRRGRAHHRSRRWVERRWSVISPRHKQRATDHRLLKVAVLNAHRWFPSGPRCCAGAGKGASPNR